MLSLAISSTARVYGELEREELRFVTTLEKGEALLDELLTQAVATSRRERVSRGHLAAMF
jgi:alanyl-tRNA synthetase